jgi:hypothetical protein
MKLKSLPTMAQAIMNETHHPAHEIDKRKVAAGLTLTAPLALKAAVGTLCGVRQKSPMR